MPIRFSVDQRFHAPPGEVFAALTDLDRAGEWMPGFVAIVPTDAGPPRVGSGWRETRKMFGREATEHFEVTEMSPPSRLGLRVDGTRGTTGKGEFLYTFSLEPRGGGTDLTLDVELRGMGRLVELLARLLMGPFRKACARDMAALAAHLERNRRPSPVQPA